MASTSSINSNSSGSLPPNPPPRTHSTQSRPTQPPPPPPLPAIPPVPPARDSSIAMTAKSGIPRNQSANSNNHNQIKDFANKPKGSGSVFGPLAGSSILREFEHMFHPIDELPIGKTLNQK